MPRTPRTLWIVAILMTFAGLYSPHASAQLAGGQSKFLGNVYSSSQLPDFASYWNQVTPENAGKWGTAEPQRDVMRWGTLDEMHDFARSNGFPIRYHVLIWGNQQPAWIENLPPAEQLEEIEEWFGAVSARYPDLDYVEVVNEPLHDPPNRPGSGGGNYIDALGGTGASGWDWVLNAFRMARTHFPNARLLINDYGIVSSSSNTTNYIRLIELLQAENLIDGIGVQAHAFSTVGASETAMQSNLDRLAATGLPIQVTELDIDGPSDAAQWREYERVFPVLWQHPAVEGITLWGWRPGMWRTEQKAYLVNQDGSERFALSFWLRNYMTTLSSVDPGQDRPDTFRLQGNYPNPFNPQTTVEYELAQPGTALMTVHDLTGRRIALLADGFRHAGGYSAAWDGTDDRGTAVPSGVYLVRLQVAAGAGTATTTRPMALVK